MQGESDSGTISNLSSAEQHLLARVLNSLRIPLIPPTGLEEDNWLLGMNEFNYMASLIKLHHTFSTGNFDKRRFENGLEECLNEVQEGRCRLSPPGHPGADMIVDGVRVSCKTEGARTIKQNQVHISKWMEMGSADWSNSSNLVDAFLNHSTRYDRVIVFSDLQAEVLAKLGVKESRLEVIPNGIDIKKWSPIKPSNLKSKLQIDLNIFFFHYHLNFFWPNLMNNKPHLLYLQFP